MTPTAEAKVKTALVVLSKSPLVRYIEAIDKENLTDLGLKEPEAFKAVKEIAARQILILLGLFNSTDKRTAYPMEIRLSEEARGPSSYNNFRRFGEVFLGWDYEYNKGNNLPLQRT